MSCRKKNLVGFSASLACRFRALPFGRARLC
jgi:hypothetical protein